MEVCASRQGPSAFTTPCALCVDEARVDSDLKRKKERKKISFFKNVLLFLGFIENSELWLDKQPNQLPFTF